MAVGTQLPRPSWGGSEPAPTVGVPPQDQAGSPPLPATRRRRDTGWLSLASGPASSLEDAPASLGALPFPLREPPPRGPRGSVCLAPSVYHSWRPLIVPSLAYSSTHSSRRHRGGARPAGRPAAQYGLPRQLPRPFLGGPDERSIGKATPAGSNSLPRQAGGVSRARGARHPSAPSGRGGCARGDRARVNTDRPRGAGAGPRRTCMGAREYIFPSLPTTCPPDVGIRALTRADGQRVTTL